MHELYRVSRRPYLIAARPPDLAFNFLRTDYGRRGDRGIRVLTYGRCLTFQESMRDSILGRQPVVRPNSVRGRVRHMNLPATVLPAKKLPDRSVVTSYPIALTR